MSRRAAAWLLAATLALGGLVLPPMAAPVRAAEYTLETAATYTVQPADHAIGVAVTMTFTNTTPDPEGKFSVFDEVRLAIHEGVTEATATDSEGDLDVKVAESDGVNVATIELRDAVRFEDSVQLELHYRLADRINPRIRVGPSLVAFSAWGFGTASSVTVDMPAGFEVRVDGDPLTAVAGGALQSGPIADPDSWLAQVIATGDVEPVTFEATVPLEGGTADLVVLAFADDPEWGESTRDLVVRALPLIESEVGLPYPLAGRLVIVQGVPGEESSFGDLLQDRSQIVVAFDEPQFTILHQLVHLWLPPELVASRWIVEGLASDVAAEVGPSLDVDPPFDPVIEARATAGSAIPLDAWTASSGADVDRHGHPASWAFIAELRRTLGADALRSVLLRTASSIDAYDPARIDAPPPPGSGPRFPLTSRSFLDQLATVAGTDLADQFAATVLDAPDVALLPARASAREDLERLLKAASDWGAPDPIRRAMAEWRFPDAGPQIEAATTWLGGRDALLERMASLGLVASDRLVQAWRAYGGGPEAVDELQAQSQAVDAYAATSARVNGPRSFLVRVGLMGGPNPASFLTAAAGQFADGDLRATHASLDEADRLLASAERVGLIRLASLVVLIIIAIALAIAVFRRRASYTSAR